MTATLTLQILFWLSVLLMFWAYFGYYLMLKFISFFYSKDQEKRDYFPKVSLIITVHNEEKRIDQKIKNSLALNYPKDQLEIIVVSDGSTDSTSEIVSSYHDKGIKLLAIPVRHGKHYGQGKGIEMANGDIIVLSDATTFLKSDALEKIVRNFADPEIGCVSGLDIIEGAETATSGEGAYVKYEMKLRALESKVGSLVGASGSFFAVRKKLCDTWHPDASSDFYLPIICYMNGFRTVLETQAIAYYDVLRDPKKEFHRKVRTVVHGIDALFQFKEILNPLKYGFFSIQMYSHKLIRWIVPFCLILLFVINLFLFFQSALYLIFFIAQVLLYLTALLALMKANLRKMIVFKIPFFFVMANMSIFAAWYKFFSGQRYITWQSTRR